MPQAPARISFNFTERCNMACKFCYIPWDGAPVTRDRAVAVTEKLVSAWKPAWITFGGGDPLIADWFEDLPKRVKELSPGTTNHLDTNGLRLTPERLGSLSTNIDVLGLPLDGVSQEMSFRMRHHPSHASRVVEIARAAVKSIRLVKINTVVSKVNLGHIEEIGEVVADSGAGMWSLYEFWPLGRDGIENSEQFQIEHQDYESVVARAKHRFPSLVIEGGGSIEERRNSYFFVTPTGRAYTIAGEDSKMYAELGNVLVHDLDGILRRWMIQSSPADNGQRVQVREQELGRHEQLGPAPDLSLLSI